MESPRVLGEPMVKSEGAANAAHRRPSLLPAFEPFSSSPGGLPRTTKRKFDDTFDDRKYYPTPVPTSSTGILPSSPPSRQTRPGLQRAVSTLSERAPLGDVPSLELPANGEPLLMGRSSNSSDYQLSANRLISRVHVRASYIRPKAEGSIGKIEVECLGWNGAKVHCRGEIIELAKGACFVSDKPLAQIMVDVQDTRVMLAWPKETREPALAGLKASWIEASPAKRRNTSQDLIASSPPPLLSCRQQTPDSPTPAGALTSTFTSTFRAEDANRSPVKVYEDHSSDEDAAHETATPPPVDLNASMRTVASVEESPLKASRNANSFENEDLSEHDEENDPIVHSFGPFGENILSRFESFQPVSPDQKRKSLKVAENSPGRNMAVVKPSTSPVKNHVINQLAFSRIHSLPLSTIHSNLPAEFRSMKSLSSGSDDKPAITASGLQNIITDIPCIGEISREGKDAAGKLLESEFYYMPELDTDEMRRQAVTQSLGKTSIRAARKQHKQYYWKRPRH